MQTLGCFCGPKGKYKFIQEKIRLIQLDETSRSIFEMIRRPRIRFYYRHKDYNHKFRSKPEVQYFLDTGKDGGSKCSSRLLHDARVYEVYLLDVRKAKLDQRPYATTKEWQVVQPRHQRHQVHAGDVVYTLSSHYPQPGGARHEDDGTIPQVYNKERSFKAMEMAGVIGLFAIDDRRLILRV
uniref:MBD domain-containing protein n=1 Tax=Oryza barthii TaxID=65489 RepID=A0A0D3H4Q8_9ORYZ